MRSYALRLALALVVAVVAAPAASAHDALIRPGIGIGKLRLRMTTTQVRRAMGAPLAVTTEQGPFGRKQALWQYGFSAYFVRFSRGRVVSVTTSLRSERTSEGFGVGTSERRLAAKYAGRLRCEKLHIGTPEYLHQDVKLVLDKNRDCVIEAANGARTIFRTWVKPVDAYEVVMPDEWAPRAEVLEIEVAV